MMTDLVWFEPVLKLQFGPVHFLTKRKDQDQKSSPNQSSLVQFCAPRWSSELDL